MSTDNRGPQLEAVAYTLVSVAFVSVCLRCYTRIFMVKNFGFDDWCMLLSLCIFILFVAFVLAGVKYGIGRHEWDPDMKDAMEALKYWYYCYLCYFLTMIASKISIGWFLLRITVRRADIWTIYGLMGVTVVTGLAFFFITMFQCSPISSFWNKVQDGSCMDPARVVTNTYIYSAFSIICDFAFALFPILIIWGLNMNKRSKVALAPIMLMACVASAAVVIRLPYTQNFKKPDFLYSTVDIAIWSTTEQGLAITAGSLATLRPLIRSVGVRLGLSALRLSKNKSSNPREGPPTIGQRRSQGNKQLYSLNTFTALNSFTEGDRDDLDSGTGRSEQELVINGGDVKAPRTSCEGVSDSKDRESRSQGEPYKSKAQSTTLECV